MPDPPSDLFLCTKETKDSVEQIRIAAGRGDSQDPEPILLAQGDEAQICAKIAEWIGIDTDKTVVDITPGTKEMSAVLLVAARRRRARVVYLRHHILAGTNNQEYGTEQFDTLPWVHD